MISYTLSDEHQELRQTVADFAREVVRPVIGGYYERAEFPYDLVARMDAVREVCSATSALRKARKLRNRLPLAELTVVGLDALSGLGDGFEQIARQIIGDEVNVKGVRLLDADAEELRGSATTVVGPRGAVEAFVGDREVVHREGVGGFASVTVGRLSAEERAAAVAAGLELAPVSLQQLVVRLTGSTEKDFNR